MKRRNLFLLFLILLLTAALSRNAMVPDRFTGIWYAAPNGEAYRFREGIISRTGDPESDFRGAYGFTRDTITLFVAEQEGVSPVTTLYWIRQPDGDILSLDPKGEGTALYCRNPEKARNLK